MPVERKPSGEPPVSGELPLSGGPPVSGEPTRPQADGQRRAIPRRDALWITAVAGISAALGGGLLAALVRRGGLHRVSDTRTQMGTLVNVTVVHPEAGEGRRMVDAAFEEMERLEAILSRHRPNTPVARLNRDGVVADPPRDLVEVMRQALGYSTLTDGAFDVTITPLLGLYQERFAETGSPPTDSELDAAIELVGYDAVRVDASAIALARPRMSITLDGIAKGYVVDRTVELLAAAGAERVMVDAGGDIASVGDEGPADGWQVGIQDPRDERRLLGVVDLQSQGVATSGDYMQAFTDDRRFHHIVDPRTGRSPAHTSAVTVVSRSAMEADALSTAALVLGPDAGIELLDGLDDVEGLIVTKEQHVVSTRGFGR